MNVRRIDAAATTSGRNARNEPKTNARTASAPSAPSPTSASTPLPPLLSPTASASSPVTPTVAPAGAAAVSATRMLFVGRYCRVVREPVEQQPVRRVVVFGAEGPVAPRVRLVDQSGVRHLLRNCG